MRRRKVSLAEHSPHLLDEWCHYKNFGLNPFTITYGSKERPWWGCRVCGYEWEAIINNRTNKKRPAKCPACTRKVLTDKNRLSTLFPIISKQWSYRLNKSTPENTFFSSHTEIWWECLVCEHIWKASPNSRTRKCNPTGCPKCGNVKRTASYMATMATRNNIGDKFPNIAKEWDFNNKRNKGKNPFDTSCGSIKKQGWICDLCSRKWNASPLNRTRKIDPSGCPHCNPGYSEMSQVWLDGLGVPGESREFWFTDLRLRVDGYDPKTNTVYEFLGDFWHGNPNVHDQDKKHPYGKTFGQLFDETIARLFLLKRSGYNIIVMWEEDFKKGVK